MNDYKKAEEFFSYLLVEKQVSLHTLQAYKKDIIDFINFVQSQSLSLKHCGKRQITAFLKKLIEASLKTTTISRKISALKSFFCFLHTNYSLPDLSKFLSFPRLSKPLPLFLTEDEIFKLLQIASLQNTATAMRNKVMTYLLYATGMRISELLSLTTSAIQFDTGFISVHGKGRKERMIPLPSVVISLLRNYVDNIVRPELEHNKNGYLFYHKNDTGCKPLSRQLFWLVLKKLLAQAGIFKKISPHSLRHSFATHLLKNGADLRSLQMLLGHENIATVHVYTHLETSELRIIYDKGHPRS